MTVWLMVVLGVATVAAEEAPRLSRIADIRALPMVEAAQARPVHVRAAVTLVDGDEMPANSLVVQDATGGIWVNLRVPLVSLGLQHGDEVEISGVTDRGGFAPTVLAHSLRKVGSVSVPAAEPVDSERFFTGSDTCLRVEIAGVVQGFRKQAGHVRLIMVHAGRRFVVTIPERQLDVDPNRLIDATVRVSGVTTSRFNTRGEFLSPRVSLHTGRDLVVLAPPPSPERDTPMVPLESIAQFHPQPLGSHRIRTEGTVTFALPGEYFYIQQGAVGVRVQTPSTQLLSPGDRVEVTGFLDRGRDTAGLTEASVRRIGGTDALEPVEIAPDRIVEIIVQAVQGGRLAMPGNYDGCLIRFAARLVEVEKTRTGGLLMLSAGESNVSAAIFGEQFTHLQHLLPGSELQVTGVMQVDLAESQMDPATWLNPGIDRLGVLMRGADDVIVLKTPSWWTPRRLGGALAALGAVLIGALGWVWALRRQVATQAARVAEEVRTRHEAAVEFHAALRERNRLAANLHDTLLQTLAGIRFQLDACRVVSRQEGEDAAEHFAVARKMVDHAAQDLRGSVWALKTMPMPGQSFSESVAAVINQFTKTHATRITCRTAGVPVELPNFVAGNLLLVAQEAIHNAIHHGDPTTIEVIVTFDAPSGTIDLVVRDDGEGFIQGTEVGPAQGHFGLQGMRERVERLGGVFSIESHPGRGTTVRAKVGKRAYDPQLESVA